METIPILEQMENMKLSGQQNQQQNDETDEGIAADGLELDGNVPGEIESSDSIQFSPPVYLQRYATVKDVIRKALDEPGQTDPIHGRTVLEVGCAEFGMMKFFKGILGVGKLIFLDIDEQLLNEKRMHLRPFPAEHLMRASRPKPLVVEAYAGDICKVDKRIMDETPGVWAVVAIELIEHLYPETLRGFEISVFGVISPTLVVVTTPNSDFNPKFNLQPGNFRHWDHKFEWSRQEFISWCNKICEEFPDYTYVIGGICPASPEELEQFGYVSQMAIFRKADKKQMQMNAQLTIYPNVVMPNAYKLIESIQYPNYIETRSPEKVVLDELQYTLQTYWFSQRNIEYYNETGVSEILFPISNLQRACRSREFVSDSTPTASNIETLKKIVEAAQYEVETDADGQYVIKLKVPSIYDIPDKETDEDTWLGEEMDVVEDSGTSMNSNIEVEESWE